MVLLVTADNQEFRVDKDIAERSIFIRNRLNTICDDENIAIALPGEVSGPAFQKVLEYCEYHRGEPLPTDFNITPSDDAPIRRPYEISEWDEKFMNSVGPMDEGIMVFEVTNAAYYLQIEPLVHVANTTIASMIKGKTPEQIRKAFNIVNDFSPEEQAEIKERWPDDNYVLAA